MASNEARIHAGTLAMTVCNTEVRVAYLRRPGSLPPLLCLHGFGSTKEDYADLALHPGFDGRDLVMLDAPGFGASTIDDPAALSVPFLVEVAREACDALGLTRFHLSGHSMGGLTALMLAHAHVDRVLSLVDIEGNLAPEDCFLSRQIIEHPAEDANVFLDGFIERVSRRVEYSARLYSVGLPMKVRAACVPPIFTSMVEISDSTSLMDIMGELPLPRLFVHGEQNRHLSYLEDLPGIGVEVAEIALAGHFPMYSNPPALWSAMADFVSRCEARP